MNKIRPFDLIKETFVEFSKDECTTMAASLSYYAIFSLPPVLFLSIAAAGALFGRGLVEEHIMAQARQMIGPVAAAQVATMMRQAGDSVSASGVSLLISIGALLFAATGVLVQLQGALNRAWEVGPDPHRSGIREFLSKRMISMAALAAVAFLLLVSLVLSAAVSAFGAMVFGLLPNQVSETALQALELAASVALFSFVFTGILRYLPDARIEWSDAAAGGFVTAVLITAGKFGLGVYLGGSGVVDEFGAAGSLALIMLWVYYTSMILLLGAEFTQVWTRMKGKPIQPERGAVRYHFAPDTPQPPLPAPTSAPTDSPE